jgi:hypothetical protein
MRKETIAGHAFEFYDSIDTLPIRQFHLYTKHVLVQSGIGDGMEAVDSHIGKIASYIKNDPKRAVNELLNYRKCLYTILSQQDYRHKANLCLVKSVDGKPWEDFSEDGINTLYEMVTTEQERKMRQVESALKKRLDEELMTYFPDLFATSIEKNELETIRKRAMLQLAEIIDGVDNTGAIEALNDRLMAMQDTKNFEGSANAEIEADKRFEEMCLILAKEFGGKVKDYTVMEFYSANRLLQEQQKQLKTRKK